MPCLPSPMVSVPRLLDLDVPGPAQDRFAPTADVNLSPPSVPAPGIPSRRLPLPPNNLPPSSLPSGVLQSRPDGRVVPPATNMAEIRAPLPGISAPPCHVSAQPLSLHPFPDMSLISSVPPPPLGLINVSDAAALNAKEPLVQFPPSATMEFNPEYITQSGYYSGYLDQDYHSAENTSSFQTLPTSLSSDMIRLIVGGSGILSDAYTRHVEQPVDAKPARMSKTARDREARAKKKQQKQAMEPLGVESFLGLSLSQPDPANNSEKEKKTDRSADEVKQEPADSTVIQGQKEYHSHADESSGKAEDTPELVIMIDDPALPGDVTEGTTVQAKEYHFDWDAMDDDQVSDVSVSSVHTSDLSSFDDDIEQAASPDTETDNPVSDTSPAKDSQVEKSCNESG